MELDIQSSKVLKGALSILIVLHHLQYGVEVPYFNMFKHVGAPAVSIFFFLSGYGLMSSYIQKGIIYLNGFWRKRIWHIVNPFLIVTFLYLLMNYFDQNSFNSGMLTDLISEGITPLPYSWFVFTIVVFYTFFYCVFRSANLDINWKIICLLLLTVLYILTIKNILDYDRAWWVSVLGFPMGIIYKFYQKALTGILTGIYRKISGIIALSVLCVCLILTKNEWLYIFVYAFIPVITILLFNCVEMPKPRFISFLGNISYEIYLFHGVWIVLLRGNHIFIISNILYVLAVFSLTIVTSYLLNISLNKKKSLHENTSSR